MCAGGVTSGVKAAAERLTQRVSKMSEPTAARALYNSVTIPVGDNQIIYHQPIVSQASEIKPITSYENSRKPFIFQNKTRIALMESSQTGEDGPGEQLPRVQCRGYTGRVLASELTTLAVRPKLADTVLKQEGVSRDLVTSSTYSPVLTPGASSPLSPSTPASSPSTPPPSPGTRTSSSSQSHRARVSRLTTQPTSPCTARGGASSAGARGR